MNMLFMSVTLATFHSERSELNLEAPLNMLFMSVTLETSHAERLPVNEAAPSNMRDVSLTPVMLGALAAEYTMFVAPANAPSMVVHI